jgi:hypothetical protein
VLHAPAANGATRMKISKKYRSKALACEKFGREATDCDIKCAWEEIAIEWHCLANRTAETTGQQDLELQSS